MYWAGYHYTLVRSEALERMGYKEDGLLHWLSNREEELNDSAGSERDERRRDEE
jgi:hypothetical protein